MTIAELEERFYTELRKRRTSADFKALLDSGIRWSQAVWSEAESLGPVSLTSYERDRGLDAVLRPVFICGAHRSGTTLIRDLLDGHSNLSMLPSEGSFLTNHFRQLRRMPRARQRSFLGCEWLRRLANPINQPPYWLLGHTSAEGSPYVRFARLLMAWWDVLESRYSSSGSSWPLAAVMLAYAHSTGALSDASQLHWWGEKTPTNERYLQILRAEYPEAKAILVVRHPAAVLASRKAAEQRWGGTFRNRRQVLKDLLTSFETAANPLYRADTEHFMLIRYEQLVEDTQATVGDIARYLGIEASSTLMQPSVAGIPSFSNSSFVSEHAAGSIHRDSARDASETLTKEDLERLAAVVGRAASAIGYEIGPAMSWRDRLRDAGSRWNPLRPPVHDA